MDNVQCNGTESYLINCTHSTSHNCGHSEDAGVRCACKYNVYRFSVFDLCNTKTIRGLVCMHLAHINSWAQY